jgi:hypothetical protein
VYKRIEVYCYILELLDYLSLEKLINPAREAHSFNAIKWKQESMF